MNPNPTDLDAFLLVYFYGLEIKLNSTENHLLEKIKFQSEEANTDEYIKKFFKEFICKNNDIVETQLSSFSYEVEKKVYGWCIETLSKFKITRVLLPDDLSEKDKERIRKNKNGIYVNPDLYLEIEDGTNKYYESVELKSTKNNKIPGSSIQQVSPFEWVIFVQRKNEKTKITTGFYLNSITDKLPFPDRSPRPQISFKNLESWNDRNRVLEEGGLKVKDSQKSNNQKIKLLGDWQNFLAEEWMGVIKLKTAKKGEKWFNTTLRKFAIKFLDYTEDLTKEERINLVEKLKLLVKEKTNE